MCISEVLELELNNKSGQSQNGSQKKLQFPTFPLQQYFTCWGKWYGYGDMGHVDMGLKTFLCHSLYSHKTQIHTPKHPCPIPEVPTLLTIKSSKTQTLVYMGGRVGSVYMGGLAGLVYVGGRGGSAYTGWTGWICVCGWIGVCRWTGWIGECVWTGWIGVCGWIGV